MHIPEKNADLFGASPPQGMNRSADQVRATRRAYVDAGRISDEGLESISRLFNLGHCFFSNFSFFFGFLFFD